MDLIYLHMEKRMAMNDNEIRVRGIEALNKTLGATQALRFLSMLHREPTDYVKISRRLYEGQSIEEIFTRAKGHWKSQGRLSVGQNSL